MTKMIKVKAHTRKAPRSSKTKHLRCGECNRLTIKKIVKGKKVDWCKEHGNVTGYAYMN